MLAFRTLTSTYLRRCLPWSLPMFGNLILWPLLIVWMVWTEAGAPELRSQEAEILLASLQPLHFYANYIYMILIAGAAVAWVPLPGLFQKARIGLLPVSNRMLGTFLWLLPACVLMTFNLIVQHSYAVLFQNSWPILTTTICLGVLGTVLTALALWLWDFRLYKLPVVIAAIGAWGYWYALHLYPNGFRKPPELWEAFSSTDAVLLLAVTVASWQLTVAAFTKYRCGEADPGNLLKYLDQPPYAMLSNKQSDTAVLPQPDSAFGALLSLEWKKGRSIAITTAGILSCFFCLGLLAGMDGNRSKSITILFPMIGLLYGVMSGLCLGISGLNTKSNQGEMRQYHATLPFTDAEMARAMVKTCQRTAVFGSLILTATAVLTAIGYSVFVEPVSLTQLLSLKSGRNGLGDTGPAGGILLILVLPIAVWVVCGIMSAILAIGRPWVQFGISLTTIVGILATILLPVLIGSPGQAIATTIVIIGVPLVGIVGTAALFVIAHTRDLIRSQDTRICGAMAAIMMLVICNFVPASIAWKLIWCGVSCLIVTPIAALPVALASSRHR